MKTLEEYMKTVDLKSYKIRLKNINHYDITEYTPQCGIEKDSSEIFTKYNHWYVAEVREDKQINYFRRFDPVLILTIVRNPANL